jgi:hypothetical protein
MFDHEYLLQLIVNRIEENPELEYKAAGALQRDDKKVMEVTKDVSAFANSNGGVLIYGLAEDPADKRFPGKIDPVNSKAISKEWLEQVINFRIRPRIHGIKIHVVALPDSQDHVVYVLEIPKGETAHQADDKKYYRRHNFMVEPLYDHEIRDIMGRQNSPQILIDFEITKIEDFIQVVGENKFYHYFLNVYVQNVGRLYAKYINVMLTIPKKCLNQNEYNQRHLELTQLQIDNKVRDLVEPNAERCYQGPLAKPKQYGPARHEPLLPGMRTKIGQIPINEYSTDAGNDFNWTLYADNAEPKTGDMQFCNVKQ